MCGISRFASGRADAVCLQAAAEVRTRRRTVIIIVTMITMKTMIIIIIIVIVIEIEMHGQDILRDEENATTSRDRDVHLCACTSAAH